MDASAANTTLTALPRSAGILSYRADLVRKAMQRVPHTTEGLPVSYYRVDLLPVEKPSDVEEEVSHLKTAAAELSYEHGYPTFPDGRPFWYKLDFEPGFAYGAFQIYLDSLDIGPRELGQMSKNEELLALATQIYGLRPGESKFSQERMAGLLYEYYNLYYWRQRARAHDLFREAASRHIRLRRQLSLEESHYEMATSLLAQLREKVLGTPDFFDNMAPKTAADLLTKLVSIQRVSVGLPAGGPLSHKEAPEDTTFEMILRTLKSRSEMSGAANGSTYDQSGNPIGGKGLVDKILGDKEAAGMMQEMIIRVSRATNRIPHDDPTNRGRTFQTRDRKDQVLSGEDLQTGLDMEGSPGVDLDRDS